MNTNIHLIDGVDAEGRLIQSSSARTNPSHCYPGPFHRESRLILFTKALVPPRPEHAKYSLFRRRNRTHSPDCVAKSGAGSAGGKDSVEMKLLSEGGGDSVNSTQTSSRHGGGSGAIGRRDATPPTNTPQATFYI